MNKAKIVTRTEKELQEVFLFYFGTDYFLDVSNLPPSKVNVTIKRIQVIT